MKLLFNHGHTRTGDANTCVGMSTIGRVRSSSTQYCSAAHTTIKAWLLVVVIGVMGVSHIVCAESSFDPYGTGYKWGGIENGVSYRYSRPPYVYTAQDSSGNTVSYTYNYYYESNGNFKGPWYIGDRFVNGGHIQGWRGPFVKPTSPYSPKGRFICPVTINGAKMVGVYGPAFMGATITELVIQSPMTTLGIGAFSYCTNLLSVSLPQTLTSLHSVQSGMTKGVFENCEKLSWIDLPPSLVEVDSYTFSKCRALKGITIPYRVTNVNASVFSHCSTLKYTAIEAPAITKMDLSAWSNCTNMVAVFCKGDEPFYVTNSNALDTASSAMTFYVPMGKQWTCDVVNSTRRWPKGALGGKRIVFWNTSDIITNANALGISVSSVGTTGKNSVTINTKLSPSVVFYTTNGIAATYGDTLYEGTFEIPTGICVNAIAIGTNGNIAVARTLSELPPGSVSVSGDSGVYDGLGHGISVAAPQKAQVGYSFSEIGPFVEALELTNACTNVRIWCEVSASGYLPQTNSATVSIARKPIYGAIVSLGNALAYTGNEQTQRINSVYVDGLPVTYSVVGNTATDRGEYMMTIIGEGNFMGSIEKSYSIQDFAINARQRYPWNGLVDLNFTITGTSGTKYDTSFTAKDMVGNTNIAMRTIRKADGTAAASKEQLLPGTYSWVWDAAADLPKDFKCDRVTVTGTAVDMPYSVKFNANGGTGTMANESFTYGTAKALTANAFTRTGYTFKGWATSASGNKVYNDKQSVSNLTETSGAVVNLYAVWKSALYMVIDLSSGSSSSSYPVSYLDAVPSGGWGDTYKGNKLVLRRIGRGSNSVAGSMSSDMWVGVFEVTQLQYKNVMNTTPSSASGNFRPLEHAGYPACHDFLSKLSVRTGHTFRLPTRNEWRYACRAGSAANTYAASSATARYRANSHVKVGSYSANIWGLYDMLGNVGEWTSTGYADVTPSYPGYSFAYKSNILGGSFATSDPTDATSQERGTPYGGDEEEGFRVFGLVK